MEWIRKGCINCKVELDEGQPMDEYPTVCFKCGEPLEELE